MKTVTIKNKSYPVYADITDASEYFSTVYNSVWDELDAEKQAQLLLMATRRIDSVEWRGLPKEPDQSLSFPRRIDNYFTDDDLVMQACCEEAIAIFETDGSNTDIEGIKSMKVQDTEITFKDGAINENKLFVSDSVTRILSKYMNKGVKVLY